MPPPWPYGDAVLPSTPRWALATSLAAPVGLIGGWTLAAALRPDDFSSVTDTISALAALEAPHREVMTAGLVLLGLGHLGTAVALRPAALPGRLVLGLGGVASALVAVFPLPAGDGSSSAHALAAGTGFAALSVWGALAARRARGGGVPWGLRRGPAVTASVVLLGLVGWFVVELVGDTARVGLAERAAAGGQALWPLVVVLSTRVAASRG